MKKNFIAYIVIIILLLITSFFSFNMFLKQRKEFDSLDIHTFPYEIDGWKGQDLKITEQEYEILETRNLISREYVNSEGQRVDLFIIYSETNRSVFHPPEVCMMGGGMTIVDKQPELIKCGKLNFSANKLNLEKGDYKDIVLYAYKAGKLYTDNFYLQQLYFALNQLLGKGEGGATIRVSMAVSNNEDETLLTLKNFLKLTIQKMEELSANRSPSHQVTKSPT